MRTKQFVGPFDNTTINLDLSGATIMQIGIECPRDYPWAFSPFIPLPSAAIMINGEDYILTESQILEWEDLNLNNPTVVVKNASPYVLLDISYE